MRSSRHSLVTTRGNSPPLWNHNRSMLLPQGGQIFNKRNVHSPSVGRFHSTSRCSRDAFQSLIIGGWFTYAPKSRKNIQDISARSASEAGGVSRYAANRAARG